MLYQMLFWAKTFLSRIDTRQEKGQTLIEYALIIVLIAIVVIVALTALGPQIATIFNNIKDALAGTAVTGD